MKYGNINFEGYKSEDALDTRTNVNIGDFIEIIAIDNLYKRMGINEADIIDIDLYQLRTYDGEPVILPINFRLMIDYPEWNIKEWSAKIIPVFIGVSLVSANMTEDCIEILKAYEPIGCRDEATYNLMRGYGIQAYLSACISLTLPERKCGEGKKVYLIDVPETAREYIPHDILEMSEILQHEFYEDVGEEWGISCKEYTMQRLKKYNEEAGLIITSRYHATISGLALGIPVINILENYHDKFGVLENLMPIYDRSNMMNINWYPEVVNYKDVKELLLEVASLHVTWKYLKYTGETTWRIEKQCLEKMDEVTTFFVNKKKRKKVEDALVFSEDAIEYIKKNWDKKDARKIAVWGLSKTALNILEFLHKYYHNVELMEIYDTYKVGKQIELYGKKYILKAPDKENLSNEYFIFVASNSASKIAEKVFESVQKKDVYLCELKFMTKVKDEA